MDARFKTFVRLFVMGICCGASSLAGAWAQNNDERRILRCREQFDRAEQAYRQGDFYKAVDLLWRNSCASERRLPDKDRFKLLVLLAKAQIKLDSVSAATATVGAILQERPDFKIDDTDDYPAFFKTLVRQAREQQRQFGAEVFVTKRKQNIDLAPAVITVYDRAEIEAMGARTLVDLLRITPGFVELGDGNERNFGTRGISGTTVQHVLILINGHKLTDLLTSTTAPDWVSLDYVQQVEIVRGPGSPLYGGSAFGGVINIVTRNGFAFDGAETSVSYGTGQTAKFNFQVGTNWSAKEQLYLSGSFYRSDGSAVEQGSGRDLNVIDEANTPDANIAPHTALAPYSAQGGTEYVNRYLPGYNLYVSYRKGRFNLNANAQSSRLVYSRPLNTYTLENFRDGIDEERTSRGDGREFVQLEYSLLPEYAQDFASVKVSFDHFHKDLFAFYATPATHPDTGWQDRFEGDEYRYTFDGQYSTEKIELLDKQYTIIGVEASFADQRYSYFDPDTTSAGLYQGVTAGANAQENNFDWFDNEVPELTLAAYVQTEGYIVPDKFAITLGLRNDYHWQYGYQPSPRVALVAIPLYPKEYLKFKLLFNSAFLPPPFLYRYGIPAFQGNSDIQPQLIRSIEGAVFGNNQRNFEYGLNFFYNRITDFIGRNGSDPYRNQGNMQLAGVEATAKFTQKDESKRLDFVGTVNVATTRDVGSDRLEGNDVQFIHASDELNNFPGLTSAGSFSLWLKNKEFTPRWLFNTSYNYIGEVPFRISEGVAARSTNQRYGEDYVIPAQFLLHANLEYTWRDFSLGCSVHNLFDRLELMGGSTALPRTGEGRMFLLTFRGRFGKQADR